MRLLPANREEWFGLVLLPFKVFIVVAPLELHLLSLLLTGRYSVPGVEKAITAGIMLCLPVLLMGALVQAMFCRRGTALKTLLFVGLAFLILLYPGFLRFQSAVSLGLFGVIFCASLLAWHRTKLKGLLLLCGGGAISIAARLFLLLIKPQAFRGDYGTYQAIALLGQLISLVGEILVAAGIVWLIYHILKTPTGPALAEKKN